MNRFSKTQIYLHWITLLFVAITYAAMELRGWFPKEGAAIFFETEGMKADKNDMNCFSLREGDGRFEIACEFDDLPDFIMIDDRVQTTLASEHLLNEDGNFEIVKTFKATTSGKPEQTCIRCIHPDEEPLRNLLGMKISELKAVGKEVEKKCGG